MNKVAATALCFFKSVRSSDEYKHLPAFLLGESMGGLATLLGKAGYAVKREPTDVVNLLQAVSMGAGVLPAPFPGDTATLRFSVNRWWKDIGESMTKVYLRIRRFAVEKMEKW